MRTLSLLKKNLFHLGMGAALLAAQSISAKVFDGGVDSANLGKGDWIYFITQATNKLGGSVPSVVDIPSLMQWEKSQGMDYIIVKAGTGSTNFNGGGSSPQFNQALVDEAHKAGLQIFAYTRSYGDDIPGEVTLATNCYNLGADGFIFDAESEWESGQQGTAGPTNAWTMLSQVKTNYPTKFLGHSPFPYISLHSSFPYKEFGYWCDAVMPQDYWFSMGKPPGQVVTEVDNEWRNWQNGLTGQWTNSIKPIAPIGQADASTMAAGDIQAFVDALKNLTSPACSGGYQGVSWWRADLHTASHWTAIKTNNLGNALGTVNPIVVDNTSATYTGSWSSGTASADKFGTDYRFKSYSATGNYAQFKPSIWTKGNYQISEWHPQGSNRSTGTPHSIKHSAGTATVNVNQQINGGKWNVLGTYNLDANTGGSWVRIKDNFADTNNLVLADAVKFTYVTPSAPAAPSGTSVSTIDASHLKITWANNANNQEWFVIARSTTAGGPYTNAGIAAPNATVFIDSLLSPATTYYYVVRAANAGGVSANSSQASGTTSFEIIVDNVDATVVGTWSTGTASTDKYGVDYRNKGQGTGTAYLQFTPDIPAAGDYNVYEWHPQGSNRSTGAPHEIAYNGGSITVNINQQINGGKWNLLGTFNFATGTAGSVKIKDSFADAGHLAMADAIKFEFVGGGSVIQAPAAPGGLTATTAGSSQINLSWSDNSNNEDNFIVSRSTTASGPYTDIATLGANISSYNNTGLAANTTYYYVVRAVNSGGTSANSNEASATTAGTAPAAPTGLSAFAISQTEIDLSWNDNSSNEDNFVLARSTTPGGPYTDIATLSANTTAYANSGLSAGTTYYYVVRAKNASGTSASSNEASATSLPNPPVAPSGLSATAISSSQINLSWTDNSSNESNFIVARSTSSGGPYVDLVTLGANVTSYSNTGLAAGTTYYYVVRAKNAGGSSGNSNQGSATTLPNLPAAPSGLTAAPLGGSQINLNWVDNASNEDNFIVARSTTSGGPYSDIATLAANSTSYADTGLSAGVTYFYVVRAVNAGGSSANSAQASATTQVIPNSPTDLTATAIKSGRIDLTWVDNSLNENGFVIARSTASGGPYTDIATNAANATTLIDNGLTASTTYYYVVRAINSAGVSADSVEASATTFETNLLIDNQSAVVVGNWMGGSSATDKYAVDYVFKSQGTGSAYVQYNPWISTAGNYEVYAWYPQGSNRTTNAPYVINYNGGSQTISVNQKINGGKWNLLGTFNFATGNAGNIRITDAFSDAPQVVIADAVKLVLVTLPSAPSGLTATTVSKSQINLSWMDNAANEDNFVVARSTTSGGPYTDIATLAANSTSYSNTGLDSNTTYYYVVRARNSSGSSANSAQASATTKRAVHVDSITRSWVLSGSKYKSRAVVNVKDADGINVANATVTGNFTGTFTNNGLSGVTGTGGNATITSTSTLSKGTITFTVTSITGTNMEYDSAANVVTSATHSR